MENKTLREHYLLLAQQMCPNMSEGKTDDKKLTILRKRTSRLIEMLILFGHSWTEEIPVLQKACLSYLTTETLSRKERQQIIDAWGNWLDFQFKLTPYRVLIGQALQYYRGIVHDLESLQNPATPETSSELQEISQEGGV